MQLDKDNAPDTESEDNSEMEVTIEEMVFGMTAAGIDGKGVSAPEYLLQCADLSVNMPLKPDEVRARCFHLVGGSVIFALCIAELPDSFLVSNPAILTSTDGQIDGRSIGASDVIRLLKSGVSFMSIPTSQHKYYYYRWLKRRHKYECDIFTKERREVIEEFIYNYENRNSDSVSESLKESAVSEEVRSKSGASENSFWVTSDGKTRH